MVFNIAEWKATERISGFRSKSDGRSDVSLAKNFCPDLFGNKTDIGYHKVRD